MDGGKALRVPQWLERREARVQAEVAVEIDDVRSGDGDARPLAIVQRVAVRHDHVEPVYGAALEEANQDAAVRRTGGWADGEGGSGEEQRIQAKTEQREAA